MTRPGALESKKTLWGRLPETTDERVFEKVRTHLPDEPIDMAVKKGYGLD
jgi:hypothetical protein